MYQHFKDTHYFCG